MYKIAPFIIYLDLGCIFWLKIGRFFALKKKLVCGLLVRYGRRFYAYLYISAAEFEFVGSLNVCPEVCIVWSLSYIYLHVSAAEHKCIKRGVKEVVKSIRRGQKGSVSSLC